MIRNSGPFYLRNFIKWEKENIQKYACKANLSEEPKLDEETELSSV